MVWIRSRPFRSGAIVMVVAAVVVFLTIKEPKEYATETEDDEALVGYAKSRLALSPGRSAGACC